MTAPGYEPKFAAPPGHARTTPGSRHSRLNVRFIGFSSAAPPGADAQGGGADSPNLTRSGLRELVLLAVEWRHDFPEFGGYLENVGVPFG